MKYFNYYQPTELVFGAGRVAELGKIVSKFGKRCLLVTTPPSSRTGPITRRVKDVLTNAGIEVCHFYDIQPNPTTENITAGARMARNCAVDMVIGLGGGSSMDSAKAIAVEATHEGTSWDYLFYRDKQPTDKTLPIIAVSTTSGTGSQVTQVAVVTNTESRMKSAIYHPFIFPRVGLVDPQLTLSVPANITAATGFDAFCHAFESMLHPQSSPYTEMLALQAIQIIVDNLPRALCALRDLGLRTAIAYADTLAGLCIANTGVTLPHGVGMAISGMYPHVPHGVALAIIYPPFMRYTYKYALTEFSKITRIFNPKMNSRSAETVAQMACNEVEAFLKKIHLWLKLCDMSVPEKEIPLLAKASMVLPDYRNNPRLATESDILELLRQAYRA